MVKVRHIDVGEGIETLEEWMDESLHELIEGGKIVESNPPSTFHKIYNIYAKKVGVKYQLVMVVESDPES